MKVKLIIDGNAIYEIDEECMHQMEIKENKFEAGDKKESRLRDASRSGK